MLQHVVEDGFILCQVHCSSRETLNVSHLVEDGSVALFQIRSISCCSMLLGVTTYMIRYTVSNQEKMHVAVVGDCFILCQVCCFNTVEDTFIHFQVMLSIRKHGRSGITKRKKSAGQGGQHHVYYGQVSVKFTAHSSYLSRVCA